MDFIFLSFIISFIFALIPYFLYIFFPGEIFYILFYSLIILFYCSALLFWTIIFPFVPVSHCSFILLFHCSIVPLFFSFVALPYCSLLFVTLFYCFPIVVCSFVSPFYCSLFIVLDHINTPVYYLGISVTHLDSSSSY